MSDFKFVKFIPTPSEKYAGIITIKVFDKIILRYKLVQTKDGTSHFPSPPSFKIIENGQERFISAFGMDSSTDAEDLSIWIKEIAKKCLSGISINETRQQHLHHQEEEIPF